MIRSLALISLLMIELSACVRNGTNEWENIDYNKIARENYHRENDTGYIPPPSVVGCVDDDLYNCHSRR